MMLQDMSIQMLGRMSHGGYLTEQVRTQGAETRDLPTLGDLGEGKHAASKAKRRHGKFAQVQATVRCKTLLLLVWIALLVEVQYKLDEVQCELVLRNLSSSLLLALRYWLLGVSLDSLDSDRSTIRPFDLY